MSERNYIVYFELFGKKMKTTILAVSEQEAKRKLLSMIIFYKVEQKQNDEFNDCMNIMDDFQSMLNGMK